MSNVNRRKFLQRTGLMGIGGLTACSVPEQAAVAKVTPKPVVADKFQIFKKGEYLPWEKPTIEDRFLIAAGKKQGINPMMGPPPGAGGEEEGGGPPPMMGPPPGPINRMDLIGFNRKMDQWNPLFSSKKHAQAAGYPDCPAFPGYIMPMAEPMDLTIPENLGDSWYYANDGTDLHYTRHIFAGDEIKSNRTAIKFEELTTDDSNLRHFAMRGHGEGRDAKGELVVTSDTSLRNAYRKIIDGSKKPTFTENMSEWDAYNTKPHYTTDAEWDYIRELWQKETIRGGKVYWEDVNIGEMPTPVCSGPISYLDIVADNPIPMKIPIRGVPKEAMNTRFRDNYGNYLPIFAMHYGGRGLPNGRAVFYNFTAANHVIRLVTNFIGDTGQVSRYSWYLMQLFNEMRLPREVNGGQYLDKVPFMKGKSLNRHGSDGDTVIGKGYVTDKYKNAKGEYMIDLTCWGETLDGDILQIVAASAKLPSKTGK